MTPRLALLGLVPLAPLLWYGFGSGPLPVFLAGLLGVAVLADWIRIATEALARHTGAAIGGLMTVSLGSLAELLLALFVLADGEPEVVHAQITGSIIGTSLLGLGLAAMAGGIGRARQRFRADRARHLATLLILVVIAMLLPAVADLAARHAAGAPAAGRDEERISLLVSAVLLALYAGNLAYTLVTHRDVFSPGDEDGEAAAGGWPVALCVAVLVAATIAAAGESELVAAALEGAARALRLRTAFLGVIVLALVGTIADLYAAVWFARRDRMGLVMSICIGSAIQVALVVAPVLVIVSWAIGAPMTLVFGPLDLFAIAGTAFIVGAITGDGETTWFEGMLLVGVYAVFGIAFFFA